MSIDSAFQQLREANPVPRPASLREQSLDDQLAAVRQRSSEMPTEVAIPAPKPVRRNWVAALAAALAVSVAVLGVFLLFPDEPSSPVLGIFEPTHEMPVPARHAITLQDGTVLLFGPVVEPGVPSSDPFARHPEVSTKVLRYDPSSRTFTELELPITTHMDSATPLLDGRLLILGWTPETDPVQPYPFESSALLYDPTTGIATKTGPTTAQSGHVAVRLEDGRVLILGSAPQEGPGTNEVFDPQTGTFSVTDSTVNAGRRELTATLLDDGRVLVVGGDASGTTAHLYDPTTGTFTETGPLSEPRWAHTATLLADGRVLLAGGYTGDSEPVPYATNGDLYDPATGTFTPTGPMQVPRRYHVAVRLRDGRVLMAGGNVSEYFVGRSFRSEGIADAEIFDPATNQFSVAPPMHWPRQEAGATVLPNGDVLIVGNLNRSGGMTKPSGTETTAEIFR